MGHCIMIVGNEVVDENDIEPQNRTKEWETIQATRASAGNGIYCQYIPQQSYDAKSSFDKGEVCSPLRLLSRTNFENIVLSINFRQVEVVRVISFQYISRRPLL